MAFRSKEATARAGGLIALMLLAWAAPAADFRYEAHHERWLRDHPGELVFDRGGVTFVRAGEKAPDALHWDYRDIQELTLAPGRIGIVTYQDRPWLGGLDREFHFELAAGVDLLPLYRDLRERLDQRLVAALADPGAGDGVLWEIPARRLGFPRGAEGVLRVGPDRIVFESPRRGESRTWRYEDVDNISTSGPFELTLTTFERSRLDYGSRRSFQFQLKQPLAPERYQLLWRRLNAGRGLGFLQSLAGGSGTRD